MAIEQSAVAGDVQAQPKRIWSDNAVAQQVPDERLLDPIIVGARAGTIDHAGNGNLRESFLPPRPVMDIDDIVLDHVVTHPPNQDAELTSCPHGVNSIGDLCRHAMSVQLFCSQIAVVASRSGWADPVEDRTVTEPSSDDSGELDEVEEEEEVLLDDADVVEVGADEVAALLTTAPAADDAVPAVGAEQATVKAAAASRAAAAMPWRRFTGSTFSLSPLATGSGIGVGRAYSRRLYTGPAVRLAVRTATRARHRSARTPDTELRLRSPFGSVQRQNSD